MQTNEHDVWMEDKDRAANTDYSHFPVCNSMYTTRVSVSVSIHTHLRTIYCRDYCSGMMLAGVNISYVYYMRKR